MTIEQTAHELIERGYSASGGVLYHPTGRAEQALVWTHNGRAYLVEDLAREIEGQISARVDRRELKGSIMYSKPSRF